MKADAASVDGFKYGYHPPFVSDCTYRIAIYVGNRWAADSDADLYIILNGEKSDSQKLVLKQSAEEPRFQQNQVSLHTFSEWECLSHVQSFFQMDSFDIEAPYVGLLKKLTVGHDNKGHGKFVRRRM